MSYKLTYFRDVRGRGEPIRLVLHAAGQEFEEVMLDYVKEWPNVKSCFRGRGEPIRLVLHAAGQKFEEVLLDYEKEWPNVKSSYPMAQLPLLEINGEVYPQHYAIARHLAKTYKLAGKDATEEFRADVVTDIFTDIYMKLCAIYDETSEDRKAEMLKKVKDEFLPSTFKYLEILLKKYGGDSGYFVGSDLTWADLVFYDYMASILTMAGKNVLDGFPLLVANRKKTEEHPKIKDYIQKRPALPY